jgi:predicted GNAT family N-acyltransferase
MTELVFIKHKFLSLDLLQIICDIKSSAWDYTIKEQKKWIDKNVKADDIHVLLQKNGEYIAYLNLIETHVLSNESKVIDVLGIGNVCAKVKGRGYGSCLMKLLNDHFLLKNIKAILLCKIELVEFYAKLGYTFNFKLEDNIYLMSLNVNEINFTFKGKSF